MFKTTLFCGERGVGRRVFVCIVRRREQPFSVQTCIIGCGYVREEIFEMKQDPTDVITFTTVPNVHLSAVCIRSSG